MTNEGKHMGNRPTRKDKLAATAQALIGKHYDDINNVIGIGIPYRFIELGGKRTGGNSDSVRGVVLIWCGADEIVHRAQVGTARDDTHPSW
jgi:hypothetical protein